MLIRGVLESENSRSEARATRLLTVNLPQLVLLIFHVIDEDFLVGPHVLNDEVVVRGHGQVSSRSVAIG